MGLDNKSVNKSSITSLALLRVFFMSCVALSIALPTGNNLERDVLEGKY